MVALDPAGIGVDLSAALRDADPEFRRAAVSAVALPVPAAAHAALTGAVIHDVDPTTALAAAQSLCLSLEATAQRAAILDALGPDGLARIRALVGQKPQPATAAALRDLRRCVSYSGRGSPGSAIHKRAASSRRSAQ